MKKIIIALLLCISTAPLHSIPVCCGQEEIEISNSFMYTRPISQNICMDQSLWHNIVHQKKGNAEAHFACTVAYQSSIETDNTARYFLPSCNLKPLVSGDCNVNDKKTRDIRAEWLGLPDDFRGRFSISPKQTQIGFIMEYSQHLSKLIESDLLDGTWVSVSAPLVIVDNNLNLIQFDTINSGRDHPTDILEALRQRAWHYGKFCPEKSRIGLAEINVKFGRTFLYDNHFLVAYHSVVKIPTGNEQDPKFLFDPVVGNNNHLGFGAGATFQILLNNEPDPYAHCFFLNLESTFFIRGDECRTLDLKNKPWSRYLLLTHKDGILGNAVPAVDVLTRDVRVRPYNTVDFAIGFRVKSEYIEAEIGYSIWGHGDEKIELNCPFDPDYGILGKTSAQACATQENGHEKTIAPLADGVCTITASGSTISCQAENDTRINIDTDIRESIFVPIKESDLDMESGAAKSSLNHKMNAAIGYIYSGKRYDGFFGCGLFVEFPHKNTALKTAGAWAKYGASF